MRDNALAIVAHDIKSPLATIMMAADVLGEVPDEARRRHLVDIIGKAARQADFLIHDLLDVTRIENAGLVMHRRSEPAAYLVQSVAELFQDIARFAGISLVCDTTSLGNAHIYVDNPRFVQLLSNLISNAIKFTPHGGHVFVTARPVAPYVEVSVTDDGVGIAADELPHVFERFWQANHHHRAGAGLGLAIVKGITEAHGGQIGARSQIGKGSTFFFTMPQSPPPTLPRTA
jgi:signal transduction histidine kinase